MQCRPRDNPYRAYVVTRGKGFPSEIDLDQVPLRPLTLGFDEQRGCVQRTGRSPKMGWWQKIMSGFRRFRKRLMMVDFRKTGLKSLGGEASCFVRGTGRAAASLCAMVNWPR